MMDWHDYIHSNPDVLLGKPVIKGTRISVEMLLELYAKGWDEGMILESYPMLKSEALRAVFYYLQDCLQQERYFPLPQVG